MPLKVVLSGDTEHPKNMRFIIPIVSQFLPELRGDARIIFTKDSQIETETGEKIELKEYMLGDGSNQVFSAAIYEENGKQDLLILENSDSGWLYRKK